MLGSAAGRAHRLATARRRDVVDLWQEKMLMSKNNLTFLSYLILPFILITATPRLQAAEAPASQQHADADGSTGGQVQTFDIWEYQVEGNTLLPTEDVERAVYGHLGPKKNIKDVEAAQRQLEDLYHKRGYGHPGTGCRGRGSALKGDGRIC